MPSNTVKCKYCEFKVARFKGKGNLIGPKRLFKHVIDFHEEEFLQAMGFGGTLEEYIDSIEMDEYIEEMNSLAIQKSKQ